MSLAQIYKCYLYLLRVNLLITNIVQIIYKEDKKFGYYSIVLLKS